MLSIYFTHIWLYLKLRGEAPETFYFFGIFALNHIVLPDLQSPLDRACLLPTPAGDPPPNFSVPHSSGPHSEIPTRAHPSSWSLQTISGV